MSEEKQQNSENKQSVDQSLKKETTRKDRGQSLRKDAPGRRRRQERKEVVKEFEESLVSVNRVTKVLKGGRRFSFASLVVIGNKKGKVGYGFGKAGDVSESIRKAVQDAKKNLIEIVMYKHTIPYWVQGKFDKSVVLLKPAAPGAGIIAGGPVRIILEMAGYNDILSKSIGSRNSINVIKATFDGLSQIVPPQCIAKSRSKTLKDLWT